MRDGRSVAIDYDFSLVGVLPWEDTVLDVPFRGLDLQWGHDKGKRFVDGTIEKTFTAEIDNSSTKALHLVWYDTDAMEMCTVD